jgi:hypothetical protein
MRVVTNPKIFVRPSTLDEAHAFVDELRRPPWLMIAPFGCHGRAGGASVGLETLVVGKPRSRQA